MSGVSATQENKKGSGAKSPLSAKAGKFLFLAFLLSLSFLTASDTASLVRETLASAFIQVSSFVAMTLALFYVLEQGFKLDTAHLLEKYSRFHIPISAVMGMLPGCGGAIVVMTQYVAGRLGFGSVVAVLTSTMGDAAFLLLAQEPKTAALVYAISVVVGIAFGYIVQAIHGKDFLRHDQMPHNLTKRIGEEAERPSKLRFVWLALVVPGFILGLGNALQMDTDQWFGPFFGAVHPTVWIGFAGAILSVMMWALADNSGPSVTNLSYMAVGEGGGQGILDRTSIDTNFVTVWVIGAFLIFELTVHWTGFDFGALFNAWRPLLPLIATLIGFLPGCGPQILVTTFYLQGLIPFSAQIANAISNDGDALFPAIALAPKTAILATLYTAVPALIIGYIFYFIGM